MATVTVNGTEVYYEEAGRGFPLLFLHGLIFDMRIWSSQVAALSAKYRCVSIDLRGHGQSAAPDGEYTLEVMAEDVYQVMRHLGLGQAHVAGLSMGGMVAMRLALAHPEVVRSLLLLDTDAGPEEAQRAPRYEAMAQMARDQGPEAVMEAVLSLFFSQGFIRGRPQELQRFREQFLDINRDGIYGATLGVTRRRDITDEIKGIRVPTLVIVGDEDIATTPEKAEAIHQGIAGSRLERIAGAGHMTPLEQPERVNALLGEFLAGVG
ncbi:MAG: alpha/beta fold hydrolase [Longimicrobiales bacterium]|nr:alpha/beta fold hydrolase [Longimicrobiales bacterium]